MSYKYIHAYTLATYCAGTKNLSYYIGQCYNTAENCLRSVTFYRKNKNSNNNNQLVCLLIFIISVITFMSGL